MGVLVGNTKLTIFWTYHTDPQTYVEPNRGSTPQNKQPMLVGNISYF